MVGNRVRVRDVVAALLALLSVRGLLLAQQAAPIPVRLPAGMKHPFIACTPAELGRLRAAYRQKDAAGRVVRDMVGSADRALRQPLSFPPRGWQHNQWYQCDKCQTALKTVDATHHRCPICGKVYSGEPYDDVVFGRVHHGNLFRAWRCAWAHAITGERKYAALTRQVLLGYAERYLNYPFHGAGRSKSGWDKRSGGHLGCQTLGEASSMALRIAPAYDLICNSDVLSKQDHATLRDKLIRPMLENIAKNRMGKSNWQSWHNAAMFAGGALLGEVAWLDRSINDRENGFLKQMRVSVSSDGMWYETSWGYHFYTLSALIRHAEHARRLGIDLWSSPPLRKMCLLPAHYRMPDGTLPRFGDAVNTRLPMSSLETAYHAYREPTLLPALTKTPRWESILAGRPTDVKTGPLELESRVFAGAGHAILRSRGDAELTAVMTFGPHGGFHAHYDKLSFVFFGHGRELGVDPGRARSQAYRLPIHRNWYKATVSHNTVLVDGRSQSAATGKLLAFGANGDYAGAVAFCDKTAKRVGHRRLLCVTPEYLLVFDDLSAAAAKRFDWLYHNLGTALRCDAADADATLPKGFTGTEYIRHVRGGRTDDAVRATFEHGDFPVHLSADGAAKTEVFTGNGVGASVSDRVPMIVLSRYGNGARFAVVLEPVSTGNARTVKGVTVKAMDADVRIRVDTLGGVDVVTLHADGSFELNRGGRPVLKGR